MADNVYMEKRDYETLEEAAHWLNNVESDIAELREMFSALYPDNGRTAQTQEFMDAVSAFEISQRRLIAEMYMLLP